MQDLQNLQCQLEEKTTECESLEGSLDRALEQAVWATNDAEMWQGAYQQTVSADLERQNGELLYQNRQLKEEVERALAAAEQAGESPLVFLECHSMGSIVENFLGPHQPLQVQPSPDQCHLASSGGNNVLHRSQQVCASQYAVYDRQSRVCSLNFCTVSPVSNEND